MCHTGGSVSFSVLVEQFFNYFTLLIYSYKAAETCGINLLAQVIFFVLLILMFRYMSLNAQHVLHVLCYVLSS
jgi:hypothetical protein